MFKAINPLLLKLSGGILGFLLINNLLLMAQPTEQPLVEESIPLSVFNVDFFKQLTKRIQNRLNQPLIKEHWLWSCEEGERLELSCQPIHDFNQITSHTIHRRELSEQLSFAFAQELKSLNHPQLVDAIDESITSALFMQQYLFNYFGVGGLGMEPLSPIIKQGKLTYQDFIMKSFYDQTLFEQQAYFTSPLWNQTGELIGFFRFNAIYDVETQEINYQFSTQVVTDAERERYLFEREHVQPTGSISVAH